ncbi:MAG: hypothetical protein ACLP0B_07080 [Steroidobacteraceae bacterium]|jgi:hypothetical protein
MWQQSQRTNVADAYTYSRFTLVGTFLAPPADAITKRPAVVVDCVPAEKSPRGRGTFLDGKLLVGTPLKVIYVEPEEILTGISYFPKVAVQFRTDNSKDTEEKQWSPGSDNTSAIISEHPLKEILRTRTVAITALDEHGGKIAMQFEMPDPSIVDQGCHLNGH